MGIPRWVRAGLRLSTIAILAFIYIPIGIIVLYSFNAAKVATWPITSFTIDWYLKAFSDQGIRDSVGNSIQAAVGATLLALLFGSLLSLAVARHQFFGRQSISFLVILPLALPGIVTGLALNTAFRQIGVPFGLFTIIVGHATFCVVVMYNNAIARLNRTSRSFEEASADLGADTFMTFRRVTFPAIRTALVAGGLLAFALSFDEIIVTNFLAGPGVQTLPIWIFSNYSRPNQLPLVNVAAVLVLIASIVPVYVASRLTADPSAVPGRQDLIPAEPAPALPLHPDEDRQDRDRPRGHGAAKGATHWAPPPARPARPAGGRPLRGVPGPRPPPRSLSGAPYPRLTWRCARGLHRRLVVRREVAAGVLLEVQQAALAAEPVGDALVLEREQAGGGVDLHPADGIDRDGHGVLLGWYSHGVYGRRTIAPMDSPDSTRSDASCSTSAPVSSRRSARPSSRPAR